MDGRYRFDMKDSTQFWDNLYGGSEVKAPDPRNPILSSALEHFGEVSGRRVLDLGCGAGEASLFFAERGARVVSLDTSGKAIELLKSYCERRNISNIEPVLGPASIITEFEPFDFVFGSFILHHIEPFDEFAVTLRKALAREGKAFFHENNSASSLLMWFRKHVVGRLWVPKVGDEDEYPLSPEEIGMLGDCFRVRVVYPELFFLQLVPIYLFRSRMIAPFKRLDQVLYKIPSLRRYSYRQDVLLS